MFDPVVIYHADAHYQDLLREARNAWRAEAPRLPEMVNHLLAALGLL